MDEPARRFVDIVGSHPCGIGSNLFVQEFLKSWLAYGWREYSFVILSVSEE